VHHERRVKREKRQQDANNLMFIIKLLSQHVSGIIMPIIRRTRLCTTAYGVQRWLCWLWLCGAESQAVCTVWNLLFDSRVEHSLLSSSTQPQPVQPVLPYAVVHSLVLLMMGVMMPDTCWDRSLIINIRLVASCWFLSLHPIWMLFLKVTCAGRTTVVSSRVLVTPVLDCYVVNLCLQCPILQSPKLLAAWGECF